MDRIDQDLQFLNYEGVYPAEKEILHTILQGIDSKEYSKGLFCFETPFNEEKPPICVEFGQGENLSLGGSVGDISVASQSTSNNDVAEVSAQSQNGNVLTLTPLPHAIVSQAGPPHPVPTFYPSQPHMTVAVSGATGPVPSHNSINNPATGNQMLMFSPGPGMPPQMIQNPYYHHPSVAYYGGPQGQTHMSFVPVGDSMNPETNYLPSHSQGQSHHKVHHETHHSAPHSHPPNTPGQGGNSYSKGRRKQPQQQPQYYYPNYYGQVPLYNQQQLQSVTGSPIIMAGHPPMYLPHPGMYNQGPPGNEMEHHPGNMGSGSQSGVPVQIPNEMSYPQHHHPGSQVYPHSSPTHSNPRVNYSHAPPNRVPGGAPLQSDPSRTLEQQPERSFHKSPSNPTNELPPLSAEGVKDISLDLSHSNGTTASPLKEISSNSSTLQAEVHNPVPNPIVTVEQPIVNGDDSSCSVKITADSAGEESFVASDGKGVVQHSKVKDLKPEQVSINGDIDNDSFDKTSSIKSDNISADELNSINDVPITQENTKNIKPSETKFSNVTPDHSSSSARSLNVNNPTATSVKENYQKNDLVVVNSTEASKPATSTQIENKPQQKSRSWASIASVKSPHIPNDGATVQVINHSQTNHFDEQSFNSIKSTGQNNVPISHQYCGRTGKDIHIECTFEAARLDDENDPVALRLGEHLQRYTLDHQSIPLVPRGLYNQSNYCFLNATLQALLGCPTFVNMFRAMTPILERTPCKATPVIQSVYEFVREFSPLIRTNMASKKDKMRDGFNPGPNLEAVGIRKCLGLLSKDTFKVEGRQEDAEEFLSHLLNGLHDEMIKVIKWCENRKERLEKGIEQINEKATVNGDSDQVTEDEDDEQWQVMGAKNKSCLTRRTAITKSPISEAFLGQMCLSLSRVNSLKKADLEPFFTLQLAIQNESVKSVRDALEAVSVKEEVSGITSASGSEVEAWRQVSLEELPPVLILHLKRFVYEKNGILKINKKLDFGVDLEIGKELLSNNSKSKLNLKQRQYKLFAVVYHDGEEAHKGHYVADCFHTSGGSMWGQWGWIRYDDTTVKSVSESNMLNPQAPRVPYLLYYRRQDTILQQNKKERS